MNENNMLAAEYASNITSSNDSLSCDTLDLHHNNARHENKSPSTASTTPNNANSKCDSLDSEMQQSSVSKNKKLFPQKLWDLINDDRYSFCLRWSDDGQLVYLNRDEFEDCYLKTTENQFHTQKAISFVRQMNMYGFRKVDDCYYENDNFKKNCEHLLKNMTRKHPNKNPTNDIAFLDQQRAQSSLSQFQSALNPPILSNNPLNCRPHSNYPTYEQSAKPLGLTVDSTLNNRTSKSELIANISVVDEGRYNDDSSSSFGDYCCTAESGHTETLCNVLNRLDANNGNALRNLTRENNSRQTEKQNLQTPQPTNLYPQLKPNLLDSLLFAPNNSDSNSYVGSSHGMSKLASNIKNGSSLSLLTANDKFKGTMSGNLYEDNHVQQTDIFSGRNDQSELIKTILTQQVSQNLGNDIGSFPSKIVDNEVQLDDGNFHAFYSLLASLNSNLNQPSPIQSDPTIVSNTDFSRFLSLQQFYQNILAQSNQHKPVHPNQQSKSPNSLIPSPEERETLLNERDTSATSILVKNKPLGPHSRVSRGSVNQDNANMLNDKGCANERNYDRGLCAPKTSQELTERDTRRDSKLNKPFKRSIDSILDSNNNPDKTLDFVKKFKVGGSTEDSIANKHAMNLVTHVASTRDAKLEPDVIYEASKFTESFVETLFDTALLIARHSNSLPECGQLNDNHLRMEEKKINVDNKRVDGTSLNRNDLTSALKLLPSKLLKTLK